MINREWVETRKANDEHLAALIDKLKEKVDVLDRERAELSEENVKLRELISMLQTTVNNLRNELSECHQVGRESREIIEEMETMV